MCLRPRAQALQRLGARRTSSPTLKRAATSPALQTAAKASPTFFYNDVYEFPMPPGHRFPMQKYRLVRLDLAEQFGDATLLKVSPLASERDLLTTHCPDYVSRFLAGALSPMENRRIGFPWSPAGVARALSSTGGTIAAAVQIGEALRNAKDDCVVSGHVAGGTHHAFFDRGEGFCVFSDIAVAANVLKRDYGDVVRKILVLDLDVHQGNGNAKLFQNDASIYTFSMHCAANFFSEKELSDCDVEVPAGAGDEEYLRLLKSYLPMLTAWKPDVVFFQAGVDVSEHDRLGKLQVTREGLRKRNALVFQTFLRCNASIVVTMGGGYPKDLDEDSDAFRGIVGAHADVYLQAVDALQKHRESRRALEPETPQALEPETR
ncbi:hypothetical protein M885DRAFT_440402 [Pelagophyceae sp. CCMP2097]|nr:hypothetical protein M885DRAFT_440402 [Pelagophyceae sp. CCMP2097]